MEHPCFISYVHPTPGWAHDVTVQVLGALRNALGLYTRIPPYDDERLKPGYSPNENLASAICKSACMVVVYYPAYLESDYCRRELEAMREIESRRRDALGRKLRGHRMFVPILVRGKFKDLPGFVRSDNTPLDYSKQALTPTDISVNSEVREELLTLAESVAETFKILKQENLSNVIDCDGYSLPAPHPPVQQGVLIAAASVPPFPGRA